MDQKEFFFACKHQFSGDMLGLRGSCYMNIGLCFVSFGIVKTTNLNDWMRAWNTEMGEKNDSFWSYEHAEGYSQEA